MEKKMLARIKRREEHGISEIHILDSEVLVGAILEFVERKSGPYLKYFGKLKSSGKYAAYIPLAAYGESFEKIVRLISQQELAPALLEFLELTRETTNPFYPTNLGNYIDCLKKVGDIGNRCGTTDAIIVAEGSMLKEKLQREGSEKNVYLITDDAKISCKELTAKTVGELH